MTVEPRPAATVILLRDGAAGVETWLMERSRAVGFMAAAWVFPGGRVDPGDADGVVTNAPDSEIPRAFWVAAARELEEEAGVRLGGPEGYDLGQMRTWSHWITPEIEPRRFDTWFFAARLPPGAEARIDGEEAVAGAWYTPAVAVREATDGTLPLAPPTLRTLMELVGFRTVAEVLAAPRRTPVICPRFTQDPDGTVFVLLPGDPEHPSVESVEPPWRYAFNAGRWWAR